MRPSCSSCAPLAVLVDAWSSTVKPWMSMPKTITRDFGLSLLAPSETLKSKTAPCPLCCTRLLGPVTDKGLPEHTCLVTMNLAVCQLYHRYELQPMSSMFALDRSMICPNPARLAHDLAAWLNDERPAPFARSDSEEMDASPWRGMEDPY